MATFYDKNQNSTSTARNKAKSQPSKALSFTITAHHGVRHGVKSSQKFNKIFFLRYKFEKNVDKYTKIEA